MRNFCASVAGRYVSRGLWGRHALSPSLRFVTKILYEIMLLALLCPTKPSNRAVHGAVLLAPASMQVRFCASWLGFRGCFGDFCCFSYFLPGLFRLLGCVWELFWGFLLFQLLFLGFFPAFGLDLGCCFGDFCSFSYLFSAFFRLLGWVLGAVLGISAVSATFSRLFPALWLGFGCCFRNFCSFSYFFSAFSGFTAGFGVLFWGFLLFQLLFVRLLA